MDGDAGGDARLLDGLLVGEGLAGEDQALLDDGDALAGLDGLLEVSDGVALRDGVDLELAVRDSLDLDDHGGLERVRGGGFFSDQI